MTTVITIEVSDIEFERYRSVLVNIDERDNVKMGSLKFDDNDLLYVTISCIKIK